MPQTKSIRSGHSWLLDNTASIQQRLGRGNFCVRVKPEKIILKDVTIFCYSQMTRDAWAATSQSVQIVDCRLIGTGSAQMVGIFRFGGLHNVDIHETTFFSMFVSQTLGVAIALWPFDRWGLTHRRTWCTSEGHSYIKITKLNRTTSYNQYEEIHVGHAEDVGRCGPRNLGRLPREVLETRRPEATPWLRKDRKS